MQLKNMLYLSTYAATDFNCSSLFPQSFHNKHWCWPWHNHSARDLNLLSCICCCKPSISTWHHTNIVDWLMKDTHQHSFQSMISAHLPTAYRNFLTMKQLEELLLPFPPGRRTQELKTMIQSGLDPDLLSWSPGHWQVGHSVSYSLILYTLTSVCIFTILSLYIS